METLLYTLGRKLATDMILFQSLMIIGQPTMSSKLLHILVHIYRMYPPSAAQDSAAPAEVVVTLFVMVVVRVLVLVTCVSGTQMVTRRVDADAVTVCAWPTVTGAGVMVEVAKTVEVITAVVVGASLLMVVV